MKLVELIAMMAKALVDDPDEVEVAEIQGVQTTVFELKVAKKDLGKVIGRRGQNVGALRTIVSAASMKLNKRAMLEVLEPEPLEPEP